jgi:hypothetical protein
MGWRENIEMKLLLTFFCWPLTFILPAQEKSSLYFLPGVSQVLLENPAYQNQTGKLVIGVPVLSGISGQWNANTPFNSLFSKDFSYSFERLYNRLDDEGHATASAEISMFFASFKLNDYTFSLAVTERFYFETIFNREIVRFIRDGTQNFYGTDENLGSATFYSSHYREFAPGISRQIWENLEIGIRPKLMFGRFNFEGEDLNLSVKTDPPSNHILVTTEGSYLLSGPFSHRRDSIYNFSVFLPNVSPGDYFFQPRNLGLALDAGVVFRPDKYSELSASLLDAGLIGFGHNTFEVNFYRPARYSGNYPYQSIDPDQDFYLEPREAIRAFQDSVSFVIDVKEEGIRNFAALPLKINLAGKYRFTEKFSAGISNQFKLYKIKPLNMLSVFGTANLGTRFAVYGSLTLINTESLSPGLGALYAANRYQFYFATNNISSLVQPTASKHLNLSLGINFLFDTE